MFNQAALQRGFAQRLGTDSTHNPLAKKLFERALRAGRRKQPLTGLFGRSRDLLKLDDVQARITHRYDGGARTVPVNAIRGSLDKSAEFDSDFHPVRPNSEQRWISVATAMLRGVVLPPVELIQVGDSYFVIDGHHRVSVAHALDHSHIDAVVTVWEIA